jgi:hypothetical protein
LCECDCKDKTQIKIDAHRLTSGLKTHCGCRREYKDWSKIDVPFEYIGKTKKCSQCGEEKSYKDFYFKEYLNSEGVKAYTYNPTCIKCDKENAKNRMLNNKEKHLEAMIRYGKKQKAKESKRRNTEKRRAEGYFDRYFENNPEKLKEYYQNHRDHDITTSEWNNTLDVFEHKCCYCDISEEEAKEKYGEQLHKDHIIHDGYNDIRNAAPACKDCNSKKWQTDFEKWFREQEFFTEEKLNKLIWWMNEGYKEYIEDKPPYRITRSRIYNDDGSNYTYQFELWSVNEKRDMIECIYIGNKKKDIDNYISEYYKNRNI